MLRALIVATTAVLVSANSASAQASGCEDAAVRISTNSLPRIGAPQWNDWITLTGCGNRGATIIASALRSDGIRGETELTRLDHLTNLLDGWFQPSLISAYQSLLRTPDASNAVRLRAMWLLSGLYAPNVDVAGPLQGFMSARCERYERVTSLRDAPNSLPANAYDQARDAVAFAASDGSAPAYVRATARCWEGVVANAVNNADRRDVRDDREIMNTQDNRTVVVEQPSQTTIVVERPVRIVYECDNRFVFYNEAGYDLAVRYGGYGSSGVLRVAQGGPYVWAAGRFGAVRFWVGDQEVFYSDVVYRPCGGRRVIYAPVVSPWYGWHIGLGLFFGPRINYGSRYVPPRNNHQVVIINRGRDDRGRDDRGRDDRARDDRGPDNRGGDNRGRDERPDRGAAEPRGQGGNGGSGGNGGGGPPRQAEPRIAQSSGSAPIAKPTNETRRERIAMPKGGGNGGGNSGGEKDGGKGDGKGRRGR